MQASGIIFPLIIFPHVARKIGVDGYGEFSVAQTYSLYLITIVSIGIGTYGIRGCSKLKNNKNELEKFVTNMVATTVLISVTIFTVYAITIINSWLQYEIKILAIILGLAGPLNALSCEWYVVGTEKFKYIAIRTVLGRIAIVVCIFIFVQSKDDLFVYGLLNVFNISAINLINLAMVIKDKVINFSILSFKYCKTKIVEATPLYSMLFISQFFSSIDVVYLSFYEKPHEIGIYSFALKICMMLFNVSVSVMYAILPRVMSTDENKSNISLINRRTFDFVFCASLLMAWGLFAFSEEITKTIGGKEYALADLMLKILCPLVVLNSLNYYFAFQILIPNNDEKKYISALAISGIVGAFFLWILIYNFGAMGACFGTLISLSFQAILIINNSNIIIKEQKILMNMKKITMIFIGSISAYIILNLLSFNSYISFMAFAVLMCVGYYKINFNRTRPQSLTTL